MEIDEPRAGNFGWLITWQDDEGEKSFVIDRQMYRVNKTKEVGRIQLRRLHRKLHKREKYFHIANEPREGKLGLVVPNRDGACLYVHKLGVRQESKALLEKIKKAVKSGAKVDFNFNKKGEEDEGYLRV